MEHDSNIWDVEEGDSVTLETTDGREFDAECTSRKTEHADPRTGQVRETEMWEFSAAEWLPVVSITNGLKSSPDQADFPRHSEMWCMDHEEGLGYIEEVTIHG